MPAKGSIVVTMPELQDVLSALEPAEADALTLRRLRLLDEHVVGRVTGHHNQARLFDIEDVALFRLFLRLQSRAVFGESALPRWQARAVLALRGSELRRALAARRTDVLVVDWPTVAIVPAAESVRYDVRVSLRSLVVGIEAAMAAKRQASPMVWAGWKAMPAQAAIRELRQRRQERAAV